MRSTIFIPGQAGISDSMQKTSQSQILNTGQDITYAQTRDTNGWADTFSFANIRGAMFRVSASGATPPAGSVNWTASNTKIPHNLGYVPSGWIVTYKSKTCDIFVGNTAPDMQFITLTITDPTANVNIFVF